MQSGKGPEALNLWEWLERDDRRLLAELKDGDFDPAVCRNRLFACLDFIVTSLAFDSHSRWGIQPSKENSRDRTDTFLTWMQRTGEWQHIVDVFARTPKGPFSLPLYLTRSFGRYLQSLGRRETDAPALHLGAEDGEVEKFTQLATQIGDALVSDFAFHVQNMDDPLAKLCFQLYLEGLVPSEISHWLGIPIDQVTANVGRAKSELIEDLGEERKAS